jgi:hypothetical protein
LPSAKPVVFQVNVLLGEYAFAICHVDEPGGSTQNWYSGFGQPDALAVNVIDVPEGCGEPGAADSLTEVQGWMFSVYVVAA